MIKQVFEENGGWFRRFLKNRFFSLNDYDIEDLIQQAVLKLLYSDNIAGIKNLTSYIFTALENEAKDHFRKRNRETLTPDDIDGVSDCTEDKILTRELQAAIMRAVGRLEPNQRYVFVETAFKGRSYAELAEETGEKTGTLLSRKSRAVRKLRIMLYGYINEGGTHEP